MDGFKKEFDVIVVGAGTGGAVAARFAAENGLKVCLIDRKPETLDPAKVCGDAVGSEIFDLLGIAHPRGEELSCHIKGVKLYPPDMRRPLVLIDPKFTGYIINRSLFGRRLLKEALDAGVSRFMHDTKALDLICHNGSVAGVKVRLSNGDTAELGAKIVIDASGLYSVLRKNIKSDIIENNFKKEDAVLCYREIVDFPTKAQKVKDPDYITIILDHKRAPGGYIWYFPKNEHSLNIGLGVYMDYRDRVRELYKKSVFNEFVNTKEFEILSSGGGVVPVRRPLWSCADSGIMFVGDAALHVNPLHGGGIDPSMRAGYHAAMTAVKAIGKGDVSLNALWGYNSAVMKSFGSEFAGLELLRRVLQSLTNADISFGLNKNLLNAEEVLYIAKTGNIKPTLGKMALKAFRGFSRPGFLLNLNYLRIHMNQVITLYRNFPGSNDIEEFESWKQKVGEQYKKINFLTEKLRSERQV